MKIPYYYMSYFLNGMGKRTMVGLLYIFVRKLRNEGESAPRLLMRGMTPSMDGKVAT